MMRSVISIGIVIFDMPSEIDNPASPIASHHAFEARSSPLAAVFSRGGDGVIMPLFVAIVAEESVVGIGPLRRLRLLLEFIPWLS
jgi:hypothetical protein